MSISVQSRNLTLDSTGPDMKEGLKICRESAVLERHLRQVCKWLPKSGGASSNTSSNAVAAPSILPKSGGCPPPFTYAPVRHQALLLNLTPHPILPALWPYESCSVKTYLVEKT